MSSHDPDQQWTIGQILQWSARYFQEKKLPTGRLDAELLLSKVLRCERIGLYTSFEKPLSKEERDSFRSLLVRRAQGEPIAYILGSKEFMGRDFSVSPAVLIPRPETEFVVEEALAIVKTFPLIHKIRILDVGSGSGCIILSIALSCKQILPETAQDVHCVAWDISKEALVVLNENANLLGVSNVEAKLCDALNDESWAQEGEEEKFDLVVSNPPYVSESEYATLERSILFEPKGALVAKDNGLEFYSSIARNAPKLLRKNGSIVLEIGATQRSSVSDILRSQGWKQITVKKDYGKHDRIIVSSHSI